MNTLGIFNSLSIPRHSHSSPTPNDRAKARAKSTAPFARYCSKGGISPLPTEFFKVCFSLPARLPCTDQERPFLLLIFANNGCQILNALLIFNDLPYRSSYPGNRSLILKRTIGLFAIVGKMLDVVPENGAVEAYKVVPVCQAQIAGINWQQRDIASALNLRFSHPFLSRHYPPRRVQIPLSAIDYPPRLILERLGDPVRFHLTLKLRHLVRQYQQVILAALAILHVVAQQRFGFESHALED
jgi:hypothetical protein